MKHSMILIFTALLTASLISCGGDTIQKTGITKRQQEKRCCQPCADSDTAAGISDRQTYGRNTESPQTYQQKGILR